MRKFSRFVLGHAKLVLVAGILITAVFTYCARYLYIDNSVRTGFPTYNKDFQEFERFLARFAGDELIVVAYRSDEIFSGRHLRTIDMISKQIGELEDVLAVTSLTTASDFELDHSVGKLRPVGLIRRTPEGELDLPEDAEGYAQLRERVIANSLYVENIISKAGTETAIAAHLRNNPGDDTYKARVLSEIVRIVGSSGLEEDFYYAGPPVFTTEMERCVSHDLKYFTPVVIAMIGVLLFFLLRSWRSVLLPLLTVMMCVVWTAGFMQVTTGRLTIASTILPPLMIAIGVAIVVHVFTQYQDELRINVDRRPSLEETIAHVGWPCLLTAITTALGFASLSASEIPTIIETGLFASFGVMVAFLIAVTFVPAVLLHTKLASPPAEKVHPYLIKGLRGIGHLNEKHPVLVILFALTLIAASLWGISRLEVETNLINYFSPESTVRKSQDFVSEHLGGSITMDVVLEARQGADFNDVESFIELTGKMDDLENYLRTLDAVGKVFSIADVVKVMNKETLGEERLYEELTFLARQNLQFLTRARSELGLFEFLMDERFSAVRVTSRLHQAGSRELLTMIEQVEDYVESHLGGKYRATVTGSTRLFTKMGRILVAGEIRGLLWAVISIFAAITILFRNLWMGLISMVPNVVPIMITLAVMGFAGIPINVTTAMIPCIALGIAVDDTIHYVSRFKREFAQDRHYVNSMSRTLLSTGKPIVFTSAILFCGFITLALSSFPCNAYFGILTGVTMISALLGDLIILPVLINVLRPMRKKK